MKRRMVILVAVALLATMGGVACGNKTTTAPIEPLDTVPPAAVTGFGLQLNPIHEPNVALRWNASAELDLMGYNVYRAPIEAEWSRSRRSHNRIAADELRATVTQEFFVDADLTPGATYRYAVSAVDVAGNESPLVYSKTVTVRIASRNDDDGDALEMRN